MWGERSLRIKCFDHGLLGSNTYVISEDNGTEAAVIDCGNAVDAVKRHVSDNSLEVKYIILTHGHYDHAEFIGDYRIAFPKAKVLCAEAEAPVLRDAEANVSELVGEHSVYPLPDVALKDGDTVSFGKTSPIVLEVILASGHTPGSCCFYARNDKIMFTGDVLFANGRGRTDFKYGNEFDMQRSLEKLLDLDGETAIYPGHGVGSTIGAERKYYRF